MTEATPYRDWFKDCPVCDGTGEVRSSHPLARRQQGYETGQPYPDIDGGHSGEIVAEPNRSYCGKCKGSGIKVMKGEPR